MSCDTNNNNSCNFIKESVARLDRLQKEVLLETTGRCISCDASLFTTAFNTIPVRFFTCCGNPIIGNIGVTAAETVYFRIESLRCNRFVTLRLLELVDGVLTGTDYTMILDLDCVGSMQCFEPISVEVCNLSAAE